MNFKVSIYLCALVMSIMSMGQAKISNDFGLRTGSEYPVVDANSKEYFRIDDKHSILVKTRGEEVTIIKYDHVGLKKVSSKTYEDFPKYTHVQKILHLKTGLFYVFEAYNKKEKTFSVYSREINTTSAVFGPIKKLLTTEGPVTPIVQLSLTATTTIYNMGARPKFEVVPSFNESKILIRYRRKPLIRSDAENHDLIGFYVFDNKFSKLWGREVSMPHTEKEMNNLAYSVDKEGNAFMLSSLTSDKSFEFIKITPKGLTNKKLNIEKGTYFQNFALLEGANGNIVAGGYYSNGVEFKVDWTGTMSTTVNVNGMYVFEMTSDGNVEWAKKTEFPIDFIKKYRNERQQKAAEKREAAGKAGINDLVLRNFEMNADGSFMMVGEVYYTKKEMWMTSTENVTHFGNVVVAKFNPDGTIAWFKKLPKNQASLATNLNGIKSLGFKFINSEDACYIMYVDNRKNGVLDENTVPVAHKGGFGGYLSSYKVESASGNVRKSIVCDLTDVNGKKVYQFSCTRIFQTNDKTFLVEYYAKGKKDNMIEIKLK